MKTTNKSKDVAPRMMTFDKVFNSDRSIQDYLSMGYLYLLILGITSDSIYYSLIGVNILSYSSVLDVLLSPIVYLTRSLSFPAIILLIPAIAFFMINLARKKYLRDREKPEFQAKNDIEKLDKSFSQSQMMKSLIILSAFIIFSAYLGYGLGGGTKIKEGLESGSLSMSHNITFMDGNIVPVRLIGHNSSYVFYVKEGNKMVSVTPVSGNVRVIEKIMKGDE